VTLDQILAEGKTVTVLMSWCFFPYGRAGLPSLLDPLLESSLLDPLESSLLDSLLESSLLYPLESSLLDPLLESSSLDLPSTKKREFKMNL